MRSSVPIPGNPWPHDMVITVDDDPVSLVELLWIRDAWDLRPDHDDVPPPLADPPDPGVNGEDEVDIQAWQAAWPEIWDATLRHAGEVLDPALFDAIRGTANNSPERMELLARITGPSWRDRFGDTGLVWFQPWQASQFRRRTASLPTSTEEQPEHRSLDALINAWRHGLTRIVTIPCRGSFTRVIGPHALLMTDETRADAETFSAALRQFGS
ncbi:hypothetical protein ABIC29_003387 [Agromyces sp. PvR057]